VAYIGGGGPVQARITGQDYGTDGGSIWTRGAFSLGRDVAPQQAG